MSKLTLGVIPEEKPVKLTVELPAGVHRDLIDYACVLGDQTNQELEPTRLIAPMLVRFMATDRAFANARKAVGSTPRQ